MGNKSTKQKVMHTSSFSAPIPAQNQTTPVYVYQSQVQQPPQVQQSQVPPPVTLYQQPPTQHFQQPQQAIVQQGLQPPSQQGLQPPPQQQGLQPPSQQHGLQPPPQQVSVQCFQPPPQQSFAVDRFRAFFDKYRISPYYHNDLKTLERFDIVIVADDSGSMSTQVDNRGKTRWDELKEVLSVVIELGVLLDEDGIDIMFLNRGSRRKVKSPQEIWDLLRQPPQYRTPLSSRTRDAMRLGKNLWF